MGKKAKFAQKALWAEFMAATAPTRARDTAEEQAIKGAVKAPPPTQQLCPRGSKFLLSCGASFASGWVNVLCLVRFKTFATMMTGNLIYLTEAIVDRSQSELLFYAATLLSYYAGSWLYHGLDLALHHRSSASAVAPVVLLLVVGPDASTMLMAPAQWHVWPVCAGMGVVTSITAEVDGMITNMSGSSFEPMRSGG